MFWVFFGVKVDVQAHGLGGQKSPIDESKFYFCDISFENRWQQTNKLRKKEQYQLSEYTITDAYLLYWEQLRTRNLTYKTNKR